ncbi:hypothetical protein HPB50_000094 [Hyalomma asiaticum]|uniref:Uncharacterized protein n=1 Tax=Hyalomma asiaticum TaxID=266040 RepID=A0ACB7RWS2_HYAAI|nr:hypothetical protein HPB50_000094 [Hyalomma asiaticum]
MEARLTDRLPMLPGYSLPVVKDRYPLSHTFDYRSGLPMARSLPTSVSSLQRSLQSQLFETRQSRPPSEIRDGAALGSGHTSEESHSTDEDPYRHRRRRPTAFKNFLPNFAVNDKKGCVLRRHRIRKSDGRCFHWSDLNVGNTISLYGITYKIVNCDKFTRDYLRQQGVEVRPPEPLPEDPYTASRRILSQQQRKLHTTKSQRDKLWRFLRYDRHVLRFFCVEDGKGVVDPRHRKKLVLQYFLVDDTLDLKEMHRPLEQRELAPILLGRQRIPKAQESRGLFHKYETGSDGEEYIGPEDLQPGRRLNIYGRSFLIYDCDDFTKNFYREQFGVEHFDVIDVDVKEEKRPQQPVPPHNGFGSPEDTLQSVLRITPRRVRKDSRQILEKEGIVLRFQATLPRYYDLSDFRVGNVIEAVGRRFIIVRADQFATNYIKHHHMEAFANGRVQTTTADGDRQVNGQLLTDQHGEEPTPS